MLHTVSNSTNPLPQKKHVIRFRYIPPYEYNTPLFHIPVEETIVSAEDDELAWALFLNGIPIEQRGWYKRELRRN